MAQNEAAEKFCKSLFTAMGGRVAADTKALYIARLSKWHLTREQWARALDATIAMIRQTERGDVVLPPLADICDRLEREADDGSRHAAKGGPHFLMFELRGHCTAIPMPDPSHPPLVPAGALNVRMAIYNPVRDEEYENRRDMPRPQFHRKVSELTPADKILSFAKERTTGPKCPIGEPALEECRGTT